VKEQEAAAIRVRNYNIKDNDIEEIHDNMGEHSPVRYDFGNGGNTNVRYAN
jgi:hypothetical protein